MTDTGREASGSIAGTKGQPALRAAALFGLCQPRNARPLFRVVRMGSEAPIKSRYRLKAQKAGR